MADRVLKVNAFTTFTLLDGEVEGHGWQTDAPAVLNVTTGDGDVILELELDNTETDEVQSHADRAVPLARRGPRTRRGTRIVRRPRRGVTVLAVLRLGAHPFYSVSPSQSARSRHSCCWRRSVTCSSPPASSSRTAVSNCVTSVSRPCRNASTSS